MRSHPIRPSGIRGWRAVAAIACLSLIIAAPAGAQPRIGSPVIVVNQVTGALGQAPPVVLRVGIDVFANEIVKTGANSAARLVFQDKTVLEVGAQSEVRLDRFVFDPDPAKSQVVLSVTNGVVRFATGVLPSTAYTIHTPTATLAVRGTVLTIDVKPNGESCIFGESGNVIVTGRKGQARVKAGQESCVPIEGAPTPPTTGSPPGAAVAMVALLSAATISTETITTSTGGTGGGTPPITTGPPPAPPKPPIVSPSTP